MTTDDETTTAKRETFDDGILLIDPDANLFKLQDAMTLRIARCHSILKALFELGQANSEYLNLACSLESAAYLLYEVSAINNRQWEVFRAKYWPQTRIGETNG